jgi:hypothetical protein
LHINAALFFILQWVNSKCLALKFAL